MSGRWGPDGSFPIPLGALPATETEKRVDLATAFLAEMKSRGVETIDDPALRYHLALLLRPQGHPTIKAGHDSGPAKEGT